MVLESNTGKQSDNTDYRAVTASYDGYGFDGQSPERKSHKTVRVGTVVILAVAVMLLGGIIGCFLPAAIAPDGNLPKDGNALSASPTASVLSGEEVSAGYKTEIVVSSNSTVYSDMAELVEKCEDSVVGIVTDTGSGSGVIVSSDGYIVTNYHVVEGSSNISVYLSGNDEPHEGALVGVDEKTDLAVVRIEALKLIAATFGDSNDSRVGESVIAIGNPLGELMSTVTDGIISGINREVIIDGHRMSLIQTNAAINPGNSGGGLFNMKGELIGVVNAKSMAIDIEGLGFAIPSSFALNIVNDLINQGYVTGRPSLGATLQDVALSYGNNQNPFNYFFGGGFPGYEYRARITEIEPNGAAEAAGLLVDDIILTINNVNYYSTAEINSALLEYNAGDSVIISVQRGDQVMELTVVLGERSGLYANL